ncbi:MAG: hypothetical protein AABY83_02655 [Pseudomonadota bacterium]
MFKVKSSSIVSARANIWSLWFSLCLLGGFSTVTHALEQEITWGGAYLEGYYGRSTITRIAQFPIAYTLRHAAWRAKLAITWLAIDGAREDMSIYAIKHATGWADANLLLEYRFTPTPRWLITLAAQCKFPLATYAQGLSTGKIDGGPQTNVYYAVTQNISLFSQAAYWWRGDPPDINLQNRTQLLAGTYWRLHTQFALGATIEHTSAAAAASAGQLYNTLFFVSNITPRWRAIPYVLKGYSTSSPTWGAGLELQYKFAPSVQPRNDS